MKKIILEIPIPDFVEIQAPVTWKTDFGEFDNLQDIYAIESTINYFKASRDAPYLINAYSDLRQMVIKSLLERHCNGKTHLSSNHRLVESISHFIFRFRDGVGYDIHDYEFKMEPACNGTKISVTGTNYVYDNVDHLVNTAVSNFIHNNRPDMIYSYKIEDITLKDA